MTWYDGGEYAMSDRNRPRRTLSLDPAIEAYLAQDTVNAGRVVDQAIEQNVAEKAIEQAARAAGVTADDTDLLGLDLPEADR